MELIIFSWKTKRFLVLQVRGPQVCLQLCQKKRIHPVISPKHHKPSELTGFYLFIFLLKSHVVSGLWLYTLKLLLTSNAINFKICSAQVFWNSQDSTWNNTCEQSVTWSRLLLGMDGSRAASQPLLIRSYCKYSEILF